VKRREKSQLFWRNISTVKYSGETAFHKGLFSLVSHEMPSLYNETAI